MLLWVCIHTGKAWKICLATVGNEPTTFGSYDLSRCGYTFRVTSQTSYSPEYITPPQKNYLHGWHLWKLLQSQFPYWRRRVISGGGWRSGSPYHDLGSLSSNAYQLYIRSPSHVLTSVAAVIDRFRLRTRTLKTTWKWHVVPMYGYATPFWRHFYVVYWRPRPRSKSV
jgi:hypothetical protein